MTLPYNESTRSIILFLLEIGDVKAHFSQTIYIALTVNKLTEMRSRISYVSVSVVFYLSLVLRIVEC